MVETSLTPAGVTKTPWPIASRPVATEWSVILESLKLQDFRAYRSAAVALPPHGLVLVAGANNSGKSALLSALDVVAGSNQLPAARHAAASGEESSNSVDRR
jgi:hypothetical protein